MNPQHEIKFVIRETETFSLNAESPNLEDILNKIILKEDIDIENVEITTEIEDFDLEGFKEIINSTILEIKEKLTFNNLEFERIVKTVQFDDSVEEIYKKLLNE